MTSITYDELFEAMKKHYPNMTHKEMVELLDGLEEKGMISKDFVDWSNIDPS